MVSAERQRTAELASVGHMAADDIAADQSTYAEGRPVAYMADPTAVVNIVSAVAVEVADMTAAGHTPLEVGADSHSLDQCRRVAAGPARIP